MTRRNRLWRLRAGLISALWDSEGLLNAVHGHRQEFAPLGLGLPVTLSRRRYEAPLMREDLVNAGGAVVVYIGARSFFEGDKRKGSAPRLSLTPKTEQKQRDDAHARIRRWWQIGSTWSLGPQPHKRHRPY